MEQFFGYRVLFSYYGQVLIFPEGTRSKSGQIQSFKKGAFHLAKSAAIPIAPLLLTGIYELWPSGIFPESGTIKYHSLSF